MREWKARGWVLVVVSPKTGVGLLSSKQQVQGLTRAPGSSIANRSSSPRYVFFDTHVHTWINSGLIGVVQTAMFGTNPLATSEF